MKRQLTTLSTGRDQMIPAPPRATGLNGPGSRQFRALGLAALFALPVGLAQGVDSPAPDAVDTAPEQYYVEDIKAAMDKHIQARADANGVFRIRDNKTDEVLELRFVEVHDPVRQIDGQTYFACTDFHVVGEPKKLYDLDFWLRPETGELGVYDEKIHKEPRKSLLYGWYKQPRYTFVNDEVVELY